MQIQANRSTFITLEGNDYLYFGGTNYLGIAHRQELLDAAADAFKKYGFSSCASRLTSGETDLLLNLERELAQFAQCGAGLILPAGFMTNTAVVDGLDEHVDYWIISKYAHGSIKSAVARTGKVLMVDELAAAANGKSPREKRSLRGRLGLMPTARLGFFAEPIDPLMGTLLNVPALLHLLEPDDYLILDEAHSFGVLGDDGRGALDHFKISAKTPVIIRTGTFSKALGAQGGFILASQRNIDRIKIKSAAYKVSTPLSPVAIAASQAALRILRDDRKKTLDVLKKNIAHTNERLVKAGLKEFADNPVPIYHLADSKKVRRLRDELPSMGMYLPAVTSYFADFCEIGLRWTIQSGHTKKQLDQLLDAVSNALR